MQQRVVPTSRMLGFGDTVSIDAGPARHHKSSGRPLKNGCRTLPIAIGAAPTLRSHQARDRRFDHCRSAQSKGSSSDAYATPNAIDTFDLSTKPGNVPAKKVRPRIAPGGPFVPP